MWRILEGDCRESLRTLSDGSAQTCVTSPPYFGLRDYEHHGQIGSGQNFLEYANALFAVFGEVWRVLADDGTLWLNLGDSYGKDKSLIGAPWRIAQRLKQDGWILRSDIIWSKPSPMPESVTDRPTKAHEYMFLLSKGPRYFYDADAIREPHEMTPQRRSASPVVGRRDDYAGQRGHRGMADMVSDEPTTFGHAAGRNKRSVWTVAAVPFSGAHFATFPPKLIEPCILAGSRKGDIVLDPFSGSGTTGMVALRHGRSFVGCELNPDYVRLARDRIIADSPLLNTHAEAA
jgi:DNA modification methylase